MKTLTRLRWVALLLVILAGASVSSLQAGPNPTNDPIQQDNKDRAAAAAIALTETQEIATAGFAPKVFKTVAEIGEAKLGLGFREYHLSLSQLKNYKAGDKFEDLLSGGDEYVYPIEVKRGIAGSLGIRKNTGKWETKFIASTGGHIQLMAQLRTDIAKKEGLSEEDIVSVATRGLSRFFLAYNGKSGWVIVALDSSAPFKSGQSMSATTALPLLKQEAIKTLPWNASPQPPKKIAPPTPRKPE